MTDVRPILAREENVDMTERRKTRVLILGATGMLGSTIFRSLNADHRYKTFGTIRNEANKKYFDQSIRKNLIPNIELDAEGGVISAFLEARPDIVINCVGIIKQLSKSKNYLESLAINSIIPHRIAKYCALTGARLVHFSTDCVFSGKVGHYREADYPDAYDLYGRSKLLGEVDYGNAITLRTSIIGHELASSKSLLGWFLDQRIETKGFTRAVFSGLPTVEVSRILRDIVIPNIELKGLYHLSVNPISKYDLLTLVAQVYGVEIKIVPDDETVIDRSLNSDRFKNATGYITKPWQDLIKEMYADYCQWRIAV
jgi:dTDP-4-dehydrorhamnose reductase